MTNTFVRRPLVSPVAQAVATAATGLNQTGFPQDSRGERICRARALGEVLDGVYDAIKAIAGESLQSDDVELLGSMRLQVDEYVNQQLHGAP